MHLSGSDVFFARFELECFGDGSDPMCFGLLGKSTSKAQVATTAASAGVASTVEFSSIPYVSCISAKGIAALSYPHCAVAIASGVK